MQRPLLAVCLVALLCGFGNAQESSAVSATQVVVPRLIRFAGQAANATGTLGITFTLHKSQQDNTALWVETQNVKLDAAGKYTVLLGATKADGIPMELFTSGEAQWLGVHIQGQPEQPRVLMVSVPYALRAAQADTLAGHAATEFVTTDKLSSAVQQQIQGHFNDSSSKVNKLNGVIIDPATTFSDSNSSQIVSVVQSGTGQALIATAKSNTAITGTSNASTGATIGVLGQSASTSGIGIRGFVSAASGGTIGLFGSAASTGGIAIAATESATSGNTIGLQAAVSSPSGTSAVLKNKGSGMLLSGQSGANNTQVISIDGSGNLTTSGNVVAGFYVYAPDYIQGGYGDFSADAGNGVQGTSNSGSGVSGGSNSGAGVSGGSTTGNGVSGSSTSGYGVYGYSPNNYGVFGLTTSGNGVYGQVSVAPQAGTIGRTLDASGNWGLYSFGNIGATGTKSSVVSIDNATRQVALYAVESPGVWFEDYGSSQLVSGVASIAIDPTYAQTVNTNQEYHVFLTPDGDCEGLYVSTRTATGFQVRELHKGASNVAFSYRIVALRRGYETTRLADVTMATPKASIVTPPLPHAESAARTAPAK